MGKKIVLIVVAIVALAAVGAGSFYGGTVYAAQQATSARAAFLNGRGGAGTGTGTTTGTGPAGAGFGGGVAGTIKSISGSTLQVSTAQNVTTVTLSGSTTVQQSVAATAADLAVGQQITVRGQRDSAGNVTAISIQVVPAGTTLPAGPGGPNDAPTATPAQ